jgi:thioredoxin-disulfide reductase
MKDIIIVGGGPGALSAGVYAARRKLDILLIAEDIGGYVATTEKVENYLGFESIGGLDLAKNFENHLKSYGIEIKEDKVLNVKQDGSKVIVELENEVLEAKTAIVATGCRKKRLGVKGEDLFLNKGVTYCSVCDGLLFQDQNVAVIGGSNSGLKSALYLSKVAKKVYLVEIEDKLRGENILIDELNSKSNVEVITSAKITEIFGKNDVEGLKYESNGEEKTLAVQGISVEIGIIPNSEGVDVEKNSFGQIVVNDKMQTSSERIFSAGDVNDKGPEQIVIAVAQGCIAALEIDKFLIG